MRSVIARIKRQIDLCCFAMSPIAQELRWNRRTIFRLRRTHSGLSGVVPCSAR